MQPCAHFGTDAEALLFWPRSNDEVGQLRRYLSDRGLKPWQIVGEDFEEARLDIEQLPLLQDSQSVALHALGRLDALATLPSAVVKQMRRRLLPNGTNLRGAGEHAAAILNAFGPIYAEGARGYFRAMTRALDVCASTGHHLPRICAVEALRDTADALGAGEDLEELLRSSGHRGDVRREAPWALIRGTQTDESARALRVWWPRCLPLFVPVTSPNGTQRIAPLAH